MSSLRSHPPARTPSKTSHAFRTNQNDHFSPFGSLAELNAATTQLAPPPPQGSMYAGSDRGRATPQRARPHNMPPPDDDMGSFYGEEADYGQVTSQLHPNHNFFPPGSSAGFQGSQHGGSRVPSRAGTGWGSRPESIQERATSPGNHPYGAYGTHHAYDYEEEFAPPNPPFRQWEGSKAGSVASHARVPSRQLSHQGSSQAPLQQWHGSQAGTAKHEYDREREEINFVPTIQVEGPDPHIRDSRTPSPAAMFHHPVVRARSSRASIHMEEPQASAFSTHLHEEPTSYFEPQPMLTRTKSSRGTVKQRPVSHHTSAARSRRSTIYSIDPHFDVDGDDVTMYVYLQWMDTLNERPCRFHITGVDGKPYSLEVDYRLTGMTHGSAKFRGAGLPHSQYRGRGKLVVEWEIIFHDDDDSSSD